MPLVRMIVSVRDDIITPAADSVVNTLYFNVSGSLDEPGYDDLVDDLRGIWILKSFAKGRYVDIRAYNMEDSEPREVKARSVGEAGGVIAEGVPQVALALSYYADRNLPRQRGRIFLGPFPSGAERPPLSFQQEAIVLGQELANLGGINVDWSLYSPSNGTNTRISNIWCDDSWDIIRSRKLPSTSRVTATIDG